MSSCDRLSQASCARCHNSAMVVADFGERVSFRFIMSHICSIGKRSGDLVGQGSCCTPRRARWVAAAVSGRAVSYWKSTTSLSKKWQQHVVNNLCNVAGTLYFTLQKHQMWPRGVTDGPDTMKPEMVPTYSWRMHSGRWRFPDLRQTSVRLSLAYRQKQLSSLATTKRHSTFQSTHSEHQNSRACRCRGVSGSLAKGTRDQSPAASGRFPKVLGDKAGATRAQISSLDAVRVATATRKMCRSWRASVLLGRPERGLRVWECSTYHYWKQRHTTDILCPTYAAIRRYVHPQCDPPSNGWSCLTVVRTRRRGMFLEWMLQTLFAPQSTTVTACRVKTQVAKTGLLSAILLHMTVTNESLTLLPLSMHIIYPGASEHSPWGFWFFSAVYN